MFKFLYLIVFIFLLSSCCGESAYNVEQPYSDEQIVRELQLRKNKNIPHNWYKTFADEQLSFLIERALTNGTDVEIAVSRLRQARENLRINLAQYLPQTNAKASYNYEKAGKNTQALPDTDYYSAGFDASWEIDIWGKGRRQYEADYAKSKSAIYNLQHVKNLLASEVAINYINLQQNMEILRLLQKNLHLQEDVFASIKTKYESGLVDELSYRQAHYLLSDTKAAIPQYQSNIEAYKNSLAVLCAVLPSEIRLSSSDLLKKSSKIAAKKLYDLPADVIRLRPDVKVAEQNVIAQNAEVEKAILNLYPDVSISGLFTFAANNSNDLFNSKSHTYGYSPLISLPLLDWNRLQNNVKLQKYIKQEKIAQYKQVFLQAIEDLKNAMVLYENSLKTEEHQRNATNQMRLAVNLSRDKYENGLIEYTDFLTTQQNLISAEQDFVCAQAQIWINLVAYYKSVGATIYN